MRSAPALQQSCQRAERFVEQAFQPLANVPGEHGATPPLEIAITSGERSTSAGTMKLDSSALSTTLTRTCRSRAVAATRALTAGSLVAATTSVVPASCAGSNATRASRLCPHRPGAEPRLSHGQRC